MGTTAGRLGRACGWVLDVGLGPLAHRDDPRWFVRNRKGERRGEKKKSPQTLAFLALLEQASVGCFQGCLSLGPPAGGWVVFIPGWRLHIPLLRLWRRFVRQ